MCIHQNVCIVTTTEEVIVEYAVLKLLFSEYVIKFIHAFLCKQTPPRNRVRTRGGRGGRGGRFSTIDTERIQRLQDARIRSTEVISNIIYNN